MKVFTDLKLFASRHFFVTQLPIKYTLMNRRRSTPMNESIRNARDEIRKILFNDILIYHITHPMRWCKYILPTVIADTFLAYFLVIEKTYDIKGEREASVRACMDT